MLLDIIYEDIKLHSHPEQHFDSRTLQEQHVSLHRYLEEYILPLCEGNNEEIKSIDQVNQKVLLYCKN